MTTLTPERQAMTLAHLQAAQADLRAEQDIILNAAAGRPATVTTTVSVDFPGGITLPDGSLLTEVRVSRSTHSHGDHDTAEGYVVGQGYRRLAISLVPALIGRAA